MKIYIDLCLKGKESILERKQMLFEHKKQIEEQIKSLEDTINFINKKNELYDKFLSGEIEYYLYLIKLKNR